MITTSAYTEVERRGTLDTSHAQTLGIDTSGIAAILNILTNMYSNPALAVVREYSCNARDSHVEAGKGNVPIEVTLPTALDPQLRVQDYGLGLSCDEILNVYAKYGSSTKRETNELIGAMGIGSKSAFTVGNQFIVTGTKDGQKTVALFALNDHGEPTVDILFEGPTDEPNGVLVDIGVENVTAVREAAVNLFTTWKSGTVLLDGETPDHVWSRTHDLGDNTHLLINSEGLAHNQTRVNIVMGGISYKLNQSAINTISMRSRQWINELRNSTVVFYVEVPIGAVDITPSREDLRVTPVTTATLERTIQTLIANLPKWINDQITSAATFTNAAIMVRKLCATFGWANYEGLKWRGRAFDTVRFQLPYPCYRVVKRGYHGTTKITKADKTTHISIDMDLDRLIVVTGVPLGKEGTVRRYTKAILLEWNAAEGDRKNHAEKLVIASPKSSEDIHWFSYGSRGGPIETISFNDWCQLGRNLFKSNKSETTNNRAGILYEVHSPATKLSVSEILALKKNIAYYGYGASYPYNNKLVTEALKDYVVIFLSRGQREETLQKRFPTARLASDVIKEYANRVVDNMTDADRITIFNNQYLANINTSQMEFLLTHKSRISNKKIVKQIQIYEEARNTAVVDKVRLEFLKSAHQWSNRKIVEESIEDAKFVHDNLPLLVLYLNNLYSVNRTWGQDHLINHVIHYVNSAVI